MKKKKKENLIIFKDPLLVDSDECDTQSIVINDEDSIKISELNDNSAIIHYGPKISGPYGNKTK